jgi:4-diphosphocytidyl-2-C-methyl-D-erythritol kinase
MGSGRPPRLSRGREELALAPPAKINLSLEILRRRGDGYHDIVSVMQAIDLADGLRLAVTPGSGIELRASGLGGIPAGSGNLAWRAAHAVLAEAGLAGARSHEDGVATGVRVTIELEKRIPIGAGLGGGSSDAAAVLLGLNHLLGRPLGASALYRLAADLGSDVPFFLVGGTCLATGRGERLLRLPPLPVPWIVLVTPAVSVETQWAYQARTSQELTASGASSRMLASAIRQRSVSGIVRALVNDLEQVVTRRYVVVAEVLQRMREGEMLGARMSGSGSAVYALAAGRGEALRLASALRRRNHPVIVCRPFRSGSGQVASGPSA